MSVVLPEVVRQLQGHQKIAGRDDDDVFLIGVSTQVRLLSHGGDVARLVGNEHQDKTDSVIHQLAVVLLCQFIDVASYALHMLAQQAVALCVVLGSHGIGVCRQRDFGVDHHAPTFWEANDDVGAETSALAVFGLLLYKVLLVLAQSAILQKGSQDHLTPVALLLAVALERTGEVGSV